MSMYTIYIYGKYVHSIIVQDNGLIDELYSVLRDPDPTVVTFALQTLAFILEEVKTTFALQTLSPKIRTFFYC